MLKNKNKILLLIVGALILVAWGLMQEGELKEKTVFPTLPKVSAFARIEIISAGGDGAPKILTKEKEAWFVEENGTRYEVDEDALKSMIEAVEKFEIDDVVSKTPEKYAAFSVDNANALVVKFLKGDQVKGTIYFGRTDYARGGDYVRLNEEKAVYITKETINFNFSRPEFKNLALTRFDAEAIEKVSIAYGDGSEGVTLFKKKSDAKEGGVDEWYFDEEMTVIGDKVKVDSFVAQAANITAASVMKREEGRDFGFEKPFLTLTVSTSDEDRTLIFGSETNDDDSPSYYAQIQGKDDLVYSIASVVVKDQLAKQQAEFVIQEESKEEASDSE